MKRIQFVSDQLVEQIIEGRKTVSVVYLDKVDIDEDMYNHDWLLGDIMRSLITCLILDV